MRGHSYNPEGCPKCGKVHIPPFQGKHHTEENKKIFGPKISKANTGKKRTEEQKTNYRVAAKKRPKRTKEHGEHISKSLVGKPLEERGHRFDCGCCVCRAKRGETKGANNSFYGKHHLGETISIISDKKTKQLLNGFGKVQGHFFSEKNTKSLHYRSSWELAYMKFLESKEDVISYMYEGLRVEYLDEKGIKRYTVPDFLISYSNGAKVIVEVRPLWRTNDKNTRKKMEVVCNFCRENDKSYVWVFDFCDNKEFKYVRLVK